MSAFIISKECANKIYSGLKAYEKPEAGDSWAREATEEMYRANVDAVNQRYGESTALVMPFTLSVVPVTRAGWVKNLKCIRYQMTEGDIPETATYMFLTGMIATQCEFIVAQLPEYKEEAWG